MVGSGTETLVGSGTETLVGSGTETLVGSGTETLVGSGTETLVGSGTETLVGSGTETLVGSGTETLVGSGSKTMNSQFSTVASVRMRDSDIFGCNAHSDVLKPQKCCQHFTGAREMTTSQGDDLRPKKVFLHEHVHSKCLQKDM